MRLGLMVPQGWRLDLAGIEPADQWRAMRDVALAADQGPFESIWVFDHFHTVPIPTEEATHEAWSLMAALGAATERVRLGQMCTCMGYRNPAYLAKVAATVDVVSVQPAPRSALRTPTGGASIGTVGSTSRSTPSGRLR